MRIYYFGTLIADTDQTGESGVKNQKAPSRTKTKRPAPVKTKATAARTVRRPLIDVVIPRETILTHVSRFMPPRPAGAYRA